MLARSRATPEDFAEFYEALAPKIFKFMARATDDVEVAYDLVGDTFERAFASRRSFRGAADEQGRAWVWKIARRELARHWETRSADQGKIAKLRLERPEPSDQEIHEIEQMLAMEKTVREHVPAALHRLSEEQQQVLTLRFFEGLGTEEIAAELSISNEAVRSRTHRALDVLELDANLRAGLDILTGR
jgi:RNA polymerase sigma-70 factor (ECF subfamily)